LFISREAREAFEALHEAIDQSPIIVPCQNTDPELWFADDYGTKYRVAKSFCERCPVRAKCLEYALLNREQFGMFGGLTPKQRQKLTKRKESPQP
jgi:WhiB family redox-sensing transcriptional regulator